MQKPRDHPTIKQYFFETWAAGQQDRGGGGFIAGCVQKDLKL